MKRGKRWILLIVPSVMLLCGIVIAGVYGWDYAKQTVLIGTEHVPTYCPTQISETSQRIDVQSHSKQGAQTSVQLWHPIPKNGTKIGTLSFPSIQLSVPVIQGSNPSDLSLGVGHVTTTALPGQGSNVFLAGHRDTVFSKLRYLKKGSKITFSTPYGVFVYEAIAFRVVAETDVALLAPTDYETLTLSTCYPFNYFGAAPDRYIVFTKIVQEPKGVKTKTHQNA